MAYLYDIFSFSISVIVRLGHECAAYAAGEKRLVPPAYNNA